MKRNSFEEGFYKNAGYIAVVLISLVYIAGSMLMISRTGKTVLEILGTGILSMLVGILINGVFRGIGLRRGDEDEKMVSTTALHARTVEEITPYIDRLDSFCQIETEGARKSLRTQILLEEGIAYDTVFDGAGTLKIKEPYYLFTKEEIDSTKGFFARQGQRRKNRKYRQAILRAVRLKIKRLTPSSLTTDGARVENPFDFGKSKSQFSRGRGASDIVIRVLMAIIFGYFGVSLVGEINIASIIWNALQIVMYICGGIIQMHTAYVWVVDSYRGSIVRRIDLIEKFKLFVKKEQKVNF
ncbi:MAG: hypothetical protein IJ309_04850 [Clostridia bacterium]|nr:hypothetical protein [Clostridia bacterium]